MRSNLITPIVDTAPASEPVTLDEAKAFLRVDTSDDNTLITDLIVAAREAAEAYTRRAFITQTLKLWLDRFPIRCTSGYDVDGFFELPISAVVNSADFIYLPRQPLASVSSIVTYASDGTSSTLSTNVYGTDTAGGRVYLKEGQSWPANLRDTAAIVITYVAGYGAASAVPSSIKTAIKMHVAAMYDGRGGCAMPDGARAILTPYRIMDQLATNGV